MTNGTSGRGQTNGIQVEADLSGQVGVRGAEAHRFMAQAANEPVALLIVEVRVVDLLLRTPHCAGGLTYGTVRPRDCKDNLTNVRIFGTGRKGLPLLVKRELPGFG